MKAAPSLRSSRGLQSIPSAIALPAMPGLEIESAVVRKLLGELVLEDELLADSSSGPFVPAVPRLHRIDPGALGGVKRRSTPTPAEAIIQSHWRRRSSLEETMLALYFGNLSSHRAEETVRVLWGESLNGAVLSACVETIRERLNVWFRQPVAKEFSYVFLESLRIKQRSGGQPQEMELYCAVGVDSRGAREILAVAYETADAARWTKVLRSLRARGLKQVDLFVGCLDENLATAVAGEFPEARLQFCVMQVEHAVLAHVPSSHLHVAMTLLEKLHEPDRSISSDRLEQVIAELARHGLRGAGAVLERTRPAAFSYTQFPRSHWRQIRTTDALRRVLRPFRERIRVVGPVNEPEALVLLAAAHLRHVSRTQWSRGSSLKLK